MLVGTPSQVADGLQEWIDVADVDSFNLAYAVFPGSFEDVVELLVPELRKRNLFWVDYAVPEGTHQENFYGQEAQTGPLEEHTASKYRWREGLSAEEHKIPA